MNSSSDFESEESRYVVVRGPDRASSDFFGPWLCEADKAENLWRELQQDKSLTGSTICVYQYPDFGLTAPEMIMKLSKDSDYFLVDLDDFEGWDFTMMLKMGFFEECGQHYQMKIPTDLTLKRVEESVRALVKTQDDEFYIHPEFIVKPMQRSAAQEYRARMRTTEHFESTGAVLGSA
jgi:hypothetical protein